jgi:hypothetical protein
MLEPSKICRQYLFEIDVFNVYSHQSTSQCYICRSNLILICIICSSVYFLSQLRLALPLQFLQLCPVRFRELVGQLIPSKDFQRAKYIVDALHKMASEVFTDKKRALSQGGEAVTRQVGEGKDIMSVLCMYRLLFPAFYC